jgi:gamma-glutamyl hercynylcysteine S-oxide synthase
MERDAIVRCRHCGAPAEAGWRFCNQCRGELAAPSPPPKAVPPEPPAAAARGAAPPPAPPPVVAPPPSPVPSLSLPPPAPGPALRAYRFVAGLPAPLVVTAAIVLVVGGLVATATLLTPRAEPLPPDAPTAAAAPAPAALPEGMVLVPAGEYVIGTDDGDEYERPRHTVRLRAFLVDRCEVTRAEYRRFLEATGRPAPRSWSNDAGPDTLPATGVTWADASAYAAWAGKRLPTEQEWEAAARGPDGRRYPWGGAWRADGANAAGSRGALAPVGSYPAGASPYGALDMVGNAWEWTASDPTPYRGGVFPEKPEEGSKVVRGGSFESGDRRATATYRNWIVEKGQNYDDTGFRCATDAP